MIEKKYEVLEGSLVLASNMNFDIALAFIRGYRDTYYNEKINLIIREDKSYEPVEVDTGYQE